MEGASGLSAAFRKGWPGSEMQTPSGRQWGPVPLRLSVPRWLQRMLYLLACTLASTTIAEAVSR